MINKTYISLACGAALLFIIIAAAPYYIVRPGYAAMHQRLGKIIHVRKETGIYFKNTLIDNIIYISTKINMSEHETTALSKDLQFVSIGVSLNFRIDDVENIYRNIGSDYFEKIISPYAAESIKAIVAKYTAEDLIQLRHEAKDKVCEDLKIRLRTHKIDLIEFNFVHVDFSKAFLHSVEEKQIAQQNALMSKNKTAQIAEEAHQEKVRADAEVYCLKARSDAQAYALQVKKSNATKELIELMKIEKWDGCLPKVMTGTNALINLGDFNGK